MAAVDLAGAAEVEATSSDTDVGLEHLARIARYKIKGDRYQSHARFLELKRPWLADGGWYYRGRSHFWHESGVEGGRYLLLLDGRLAGKGLNFHPQPTEPFVLEKVPGLPPKIAELFSEMSEPLKELVSLSPLMALNPGN